MSKDSVSSVSRRANPSIPQREHSLFFPLRGRVSGVFFKDTTRGKQTLVHLYMYGQWPDLFNVPLLHSKINSQNGEDWTPERGDEVAVQFFGGDINDPVVIGFLPPPGNAIEAETAEAPRYNRRRNGTDEVIDKEGSRIIYVAKNDTLVVEEDATIHVKGDASLTVDGNVNIQVGGDLTANVDGTSTVTCPEIFVNADTKVSFNTPLAEFSGKVVAADNIESEAELRDSVGKVSTLRDTYNEHQHSVGGDPPIQQVEAEE